MWFYEPQPKQLDPLEPQPRWVRYRGGGSSRVPRQIHLRLATSRNSLYSQLPSHRISTARGQSVRSTQDPKSGFAVTVLQRQARHIPLQSGYNDQSVCSRKKPAPSTCSTITSCLEQPSDELHYMPGRYFNYGKFTNFWQRFTKNETPILLIVFHFFIKTFWGLNLLPTSDMRYSTKYVCSVGPFRLSLYHWTTNDILCGIFSSRRQGLELSIRTVDRTEHEAQCAKSHYCSSVKWKSLLRAKHVKKEVSGLLKIPHYYINTGSVHKQIHIHTRTHARTYPHHNEQQWVSIPKSGFQGKMCQFRCHVKHWLNLTKIVYMG